MKAPLSWIREFLPEAPGADDLALLLLKRGFEVESIQRPAGFGPLVVVGRILTVEKHPGADRLSVTTVDVGEALPRTIVCGASNIKPGQAVPAALPGAVLPGDFKIKKSKIRGVESEGMLCSASELKLAEDAAGILILGENGAGPKPGLLFDEARGGSDPVLDIAVPPNRPDGLSILGLAREIGAGLGQLAAWKPPMAAQAGNVSPLSIEILDRQACPAYMGLSMNLSALAPTPPEALARLEACGFRGRGALVDATNYVLLELGHPCHVFDRSKISGGTILIRPAKTGEKLLGLDGGEHSLTGEDLVIADAKGSLALAGIVGGEPSSAGPDTRQVFLECASFHPGRLRKTARRLSLATESSVRFERGVPVPGLPLALGRLRDLLMSWTGAKSEGSPVSEGDLKDHRVRIDFDPVSALKRLGYADPEARAQILPRAFAFMGMEVLRKKDSDACEVTVPYYRPDLRSTEDLDEEIARSFGMDEVPETLPAGQLPPPRRESLPSFAEKARAALRGQGFQEVLTSPFLAQGSIPRESLGPSPALAHPLSQEESLLRNTLIPGLLKAAAHNMARGGRDLRLFETGRVFASNGKEGPREELWLGALMGGSAHPRSWAEGRDLDLYDLRGALESLLEDLGLKLRFEAAELKGWSPGAAWRLGQGETPIGWAGIPLPPPGLLPKNAPPIYAFELSLGRSLGRAGNSASAQVPSRFPGVVRDLNFLVPETLEAGRLEALIRKTAGRELESLDLRDLYKGRPVPEGMRSLTYSLVFRSPEKTLEEADVEPRVAAVVQASEKELGLKIRSA